MDLQKRKVSKDLVIPEKHRIFAAQRVVFDIVKLALMTLKLISETYERDGLDSIPVL